MSDTTSDAGEEKAARPFADFVRELRGGAVHDELTEALHNLIAAVESTRKKGKVTFSIELAYEKGTQTLAVKDVVVAAIPKPDRAKTLWFVDREGNLTRNDPNQLQFSGIKIVTPETREAKQA
ncbi:hypothetical protein [Nocardia africana]